MKHSFSEHRLIYKTGGRIASSAAKRVAAAKAPAKPAAPARSVFGNRVSSAGVAANSAAAAQAAIGATRAAQLVAGKAAASRTELLAKGAVQSDPKLKQEFQDYQTFWDQLAKMDPADRNKILGDIKQEAQSAVDPYYDEIGQYAALQKEIDSRTRDLRRQDIVSTATTRFNRGVEDLTLQAGGALGDVSAAAFKRGTADSGVEKSLADRIIEAKQRGQDRASQDLEYTKNLSQKEYDLGVESDALTYKQKFASLGRQRLFDTSVEQSDIFSDLERYNYLNAGEAATIPFYGSNLNTPKPQAPASTLQSRLQARADARTGKLAPLPPTPAPRPSTTPRPTGAVNPKSVKVDLATRRYSFR